MKKYILYIPVLLVMFICINSCKKFLDKKSDESISKPETLGDLQELLDNPNLNRGMRLINSSADEYYLDYTVWNSRSTLDKGSYIWDTNLNDYLDWRDTYTNAFYANTVLDNLKDIVVGPSDQEVANYIKGQALFLRAHCFYQIAQLYGAQFNTSALSSELGIPLRLNSNFNEPSTRASVSQTHNQIINDLNEAVNLLNNTTPSTSLYKKRPTKAACYALLARMFLLMGDYIKAEQSATACLSQYNVLLDYNDPAQVDTVTTTNPAFKLYNPEVIFHISIGSSLNSNTSAKVDTTLYKLYDNNDLRKKLFFRKNSDPSYRFRGSYNGSLTDLFNGIAVDEIYLIRAESFARQGKVNQALTDLNILLSKRIRGSQFVPISTSDASQALVMILNERRKELLYRGLRWPDLRRLNKETNFQTTLKRVLNGQVYQLLPDDKKYILLIPIEVMSMSSLQQNPR